MIVSSRGILVDAGAKLGHELIPELRGTGVQSLSKLGLCSLFFVFKGLLLLSMQFFLQGDGASSAMQSALGFGELFLFLLGLFFKRFRDLDIVHFRFNDIVHSLVHFVLSLSQLVGSKIQVL